MTQSSRRCLPLISLTLLLLVLGWPRAASAQFSGVIQGTITDVRRRLSPTPSSW